MNDKSFSRRDFVKFMGGSTAALMAISPAALLTSCKNDIGLKGITPTLQDELVLAPGLDYSVLIKWEDKLNTEDYFGFNNDYTAFFELSESEAILWVNHEYPHPMFIGGWMKGGPRTKEQVDKERYNLGGSLVHIKKDKNNRWSYVENSQYNRRLTATTEIPLIATRDIKGARVAVGTFAGCAGGVTPWKTVLSCEENYQDYYGDYSSKGEFKKSKFKWDDFYKLPPEHYGWVVEVDPLTGVAKKLTAMGRMSREGATATVAKDGRVVVYSGDDKANEHIYKYISKSTDSLDEGELFVANLEKGQWLSLDWSKSKVLQDNFKDQMDVLIYAREAAKLLGATPCDRPEDVEINPKTNDIFVCLTNNYNKNEPDNPKNNYYGKILKISETNADPLSLTFTSSDFAVGGNDSGFACPDNMIFDHNGNLWMTTDISGDMVAKGPYEKFKNNGLFYFPLSGKDAGRAIQMGSAPVDAELTGLSLSTDKKTLFLSVQHPGEKSKSLTELNSHWPKGGNEMPRPAVVQIFGPLFDKLNG
ncbi:PF05787 family protein [Bacteriovorax sp. BSW11_IV]|uniref:PhoX family protein n=1 Tax=Bacteriovorax sp. BSW11_IV TaxID=1353529 RepID=UPI00038A4460|nr:alkaline phosphatase PhoX [Bacteriovorax sp. BSW11_IV]EQC50379.1 PF05787 family protein [Bacteriovorax sp. BSW11_IV]